MPFERASTSAFPHTSSVTADDDSITQHGPSKESLALLTLCIFQEASEPKRRLSDAFSDGGTLAQETSQGPGQVSASPPVLTPEGVTPASRPGIATNPSLPPSAYGSMARSLPRDLLTGSPAPNQRTHTPDLQVGPFFTIQYTRAQSRVLLLRDSPNLAFHPKHP